MLKVVLRSRNVHETVRTKAECKDCKASGALGTTAQRCGIVWHRRHMDKTATARVRACPLAAAESLCALEIAWQHDSGLLLATISEAESQNLTKFEIIRCEHVWINDGNVLETMNLLVSQKSSALGHNGAALCGHCRCKQGIDLGPRCSRSRPCRVAARSEHFGSFKNREEQYFCQ